MTQTALTLAGTWSLTNNSGSHACDMRVPGDNITAMHAAGLIDDPYWGENEYGLRWIADEDWTIRRKFKLDDPNVDLVLAGLDTICSITVNATPVGATQNAFRRYRFDLSQAAVAGQNEIVIIFHSVTREANARAAVQPFEIPNSTNNPVSNGNLIRKPACDFGWDWNACLMPFGVTDDIGIEPRDAARIDDIIIHQDHSDAQVTVSVQAKVSNADGQTITLELGDTTQTAIARDGTATANFTLTSPALWWPAGQGDQPLHALTISVGDAVQTRRIGLRDAHLISEPDDAGRSFALRINERDVFAKGANWIPADALFGNITRDKTRALLQSAVDANMNMIRIWGGGRYEADWFYDMCDELGLMVWQDFMFACNIYPSDPGYLADVHAEVADNVLRLQHHCSIVLWCGDNELVGALDWYDVTRNNRDRYIVNYDRLNRTIEQALSDTDPTANWWPSSPTKGPMDFGDAWHGDGAGDMHFWSVWHEGRDFEHYRDVQPRFCSEFGFQSYPSMSVIRKFADPEDFNIASPVLESHQKNDGGNARIAETMFRYFRWPEKFEDFVWLSQLQQGLAIKTAVDYWRSLTPHCMGTLYWQLNDTWPVCSWASLDHGGGWKLLHQMARDFYAPVHVVAIPQGNEIAFHALNDTPDKTALTLMLYTCDLDGSQTAIGSRDVKLEPNKAQHLLSVPLEQLGPDQLLAFEWTGDNGLKGHDIIAPRPWKTYPLQASNCALDVTKREGAYAVSLTADALALFATVEASTAGRWSRNAVHLRPGHITTLTFTPDTLGPSPDFTVRDLHSATMAPQQRTHDR